MRETTVEENLETGGGGCLFHDNDDGSDHENHNVDDGSSLCSETSCSNSDNRQLRHRPRRRRSRRRSRGDCHSDASSQNNNNNSIHTTNSTPTDRDDDVEPKGSSTSILVVKVAVIALLVVTASIGTVLTNEYTRHQEDQRYKTSLKNHAFRLLEGFYALTDKRVAAAAQLSVAMTSHVLSSPTLQWPNVSMPHFEQRCAVPMYQSQASFVTFAPLLRTPTERYQWEQYATRIEQHERVDGMAAAMTPTDAAARTRRATQRRRRLSDPTAAENNLYYTEASMDLEMAKEVYNRTVEDGIHRLQANVFVDDTTDGPYSPMWQIAPIEGNEPLIMFNQYSDPVCEEALEVMLHFEGVVLSRMVGKPPRSPKSYFFVPVFDDFWVEEEEADMPLNHSNATAPAPKIVGSISLEVDWLKYLSGILPGSSSEGSVDLVLQNSCGDVHTFRTKGASAVYVGAGDLHDSGLEKDSQKSDPEKLHYLCGSVPFLEIYINGYRKNNNSDATANDDGGNNSYHKTNVSSCIYSLTIHPTSEFRSHYKTSNPVVFTTFVALIFVFALLTFLVYDCLVERRQTQVMEKAVLANNIVRSLFPDSVRERLFRSSSRSSTSTSATLESGSHHIPPSPVGHASTKVKQLTETPKLRLKTFLKNHSSVPHGSHTSARSDARNLTRQLSINQEPIADLFPHTTIMFADIAGFTAWSSEREPHQVFQLLETLYRAFDQVANRLGVFKVETIGDCYVAVAGLPDPNSDHAVVMARFAFDCMIQMKQLTKKLEVHLGPGTTELSMRFGLHSGAVTAGVLRGEKSRFQLFGDTMNTAARMEGTGEPDRIQVSQETAHLLQKAGKDHWLTPREGLVSVKGKGDMPTFWLYVCKKPYPREQPTIETTLSSANEGTSEQWGHLSIDSSHSSLFTHVGKEHRLVDWNVEVLLCLLDKLVQHRLATYGKRRRSRFSAEEPLKVSILDEVAEVITLPKFHPTKGNANNGGGVQRKLPLEVKVQLKEYVATIASMYRNVSFHNFEHASHVTMSANKLMKRIIAPGDALVHDASKANQLNEFNANLHKSTFGISSDPMAQFAIVFAALIHDVEHTGVPNAQLVKEEADVAKRFHNQSVAEQNSVVIAWDLLMERRFEAVQNCIFSNETEKARFRQLVVNAVMATDIMDGELVALRKNRWEKAFDKKDENEVEGVQEMNRKATIVIEHIIQASDVAHTMQHWHIFTRWNERLFREMYFAYLNGRAEVDPFPGWYEGQIRFFDFYIIPLAKKLKECGVFGVSSDEYLMYALENRTEWEIKGREETDKMMARVKLDLEQQRPV